MIERKFIAQRVKELQIQQYIIQQLGNIGNSKIEIKKTPLGEKIIIYSSRPGVIVGRKGENIKRLTSTLKTKFKLENPQIEIGDAPNPHLDPNAIADKIAFTLERYGAKRFKFIGYETLKNMIAAGALGGEVVISGKVPSSRAKSWRFYAGYLKKSGDVAVSQVKRAHTIAILKTGVLGIKVSVMPPDIILPDKIIIREPVVKVEVTDAESGEVAHEEVEAPKKKEVKKQSQDKSKKQAKKAPKKKKEEAVVEAQE